MTQIVTERHFIHPIKCPHCQTKQVVQVLARSGFHQMGDQHVECVECKTTFAVMVPDRIIGGPFPEN